MPDADGNLIVGDPGYIAPVVTTDTTAPPEVTLPDIPGEEALAKTTAAYDTASTGVLDRAENAYDVGYTAPSLPQEFAPKEGSSYVTPESTVAGQLTTLLSKDSDYIKQAEAKARIGANQLGLASSSMAEGAARGAAIERALPIAQQDAQTYGQAQQQQQAAEVNQAQASIEGLVSGALNDQKYELIDRSQALQSTFDGAIKAADAEAGVALQELKSQWDFALTDSIKRLEYYLQKDLNEQSIDDGKAENVRAQSADIIKNNQIAIENLLKDPDILQLGAESYGALINNMTAMTTKSIQFIYSAASLDMDGMMEDLLSDFEGGVQW
jgi:hypothetical protein